MPRPAAPERAAAAAALVVGLLLTAGLVALQVHYQRHAGALWRDEVNSVNVAELPTLGAVLDASRYDSFPMAWVTVLHGWIALGLGDGDPALRRLGALVFLGTLGVLWWSARRLGAGVPLVALLCFGLSPTAIVYGGELRGYGLGALAMAWAFGAIWAFVERPGRGRAVVAQLAAVAAAQTYFGNCFLLAVVCGAACLRPLRRGTPRVAVAVLGMGAVAAASMAINLPSVLYAAHLSHIEQGDPSLVWLAQVFGHALGAGVPWLGVCWGVAAVLALAGCATTLASGDADDRDRALYVLVAGIGGVAAWAAYTLAIRVQTQFWYYLPLMAVVALACDVGVGLLARRAAWGGWVRAAAVAALAGLLARDVAATVPLRMTSVDLAAEAVASRAQPGDLVVVAPWYVGISFARYWRGTPPWITLPDFDEHRYHLHALVEEKMRRGEDAIAPELGRIASTLQAGGRVWLVGDLPVPQPGQTMAPLPPAPAGSRAAPYLEGWELRTGGFLQRHARDIARVDVPVPGPVSRHEHVGVFAFSGWQDPPAS